MSKYIPPALRNQNCKNKPVIKNEETTVIKENSVSKKGEWVEKAEMREERDDIVMEEFEDYPEIRKLGRALEQGRQNLKEREFKRWYEYYENELNELYREVDKRYEKVLTKIRLENKNYQKTDVQIKIIPMISFEEFCIYVYLNTIIPKYQRYMKSI